MSSTARLILDTLDKMSTPLADARRIPVPTSAPATTSRAERRRRIAEELLEGGSTLLGARKRARPNLGSAGSSPSSVSAASADGQRRGPQLNGPPLRTNLFSPLASASRRTPPQPTPEAKLTKLTTRPAAKAATAPKSNSGTLVGLDFSAAFTSKPAGGAKPALMTATQSSSTASTVSFTSLENTPRSVNSGHSSATSKIRAKVGEKARARVDRAFEEANAGGEVLPDHLSKPTSVNPFASLADMPKFQLETKKDKPAVDVMAGVFAATSPKKKPQTEQATSSAPPLVNGNVNGGNGHAEDDDRPASFAFSAPQKLVVAANVQTAATSPSTFAFSQPQALT